MHCQIYFGIHLFCFWCNFWQFEFGSWLLPPLADSESSQAFHSFSAMRYWDDIICKALSQFNARCACGVWRTRGYSCSNNKTMNENVFIQVIPNLFTLSDNALFRRHAARHSPCVSVLTGSSGESIGQTPLSRFQVKTRTALSHRNVHSSGNTEGSHPPTKGSGWFGWAATFGTMAAGLRCWAAVIPPQAEPLMCPVAPPLVCLTTLRATVCRWMCVCRHKSSADNAA